MSLKSSATVVVLCLMLAVGAATERNTKKTDPQSADEPLRLSISPMTGKPGEAIAFRVTIENNGDDDLVVNLGMMLANGKMQLPKAIRLVWTDSKGKTRELHHADRRYSGIAGRVDDYAVPLRAGSSYSMKVRLNNYYCPATEEFEFQFPPGSHRVRADFLGRGAEHINGDTQGIKLITFWKGKVQSEEVEFAVPRRE